MLGRTCEYRGCAWGWQGSQKGFLFDMELVAADPCGRLGAGPWIVGSERWE